MGQSRLGVMWSGQEGWELARLVGLSVLGPLFMEASIFVSSRTYAPSQLKVQDLGFKVRA